MASATVHGTATARLIQAALRGALTQAQARRLSECFDMLAPQGFGEIIGGSAREEDLERLTARMKHEQLPLDDYDWYLDLRRYGSVPHGGFGLGVERTVAWICNLKHIRETIPYPRMMGRFYP